MSTFGLRISDASGDSIKITPDMSYIADSSQVVLPTTLVDTNKYYVPVYLPTYSSVPIDNVNVMINAFLLNVKINVTVTSVATSYGATAVADYFTTQYTKDLSTGVMTAWTPGINQNPLTDGHWDLITSIYPDIYWDKLSDTDITFIKLFAAMRYNCYDASAGTYINSYIFGNNGIEKIDYTILMSKKEYV
jgi:hypothetical protein